MTESNHSQLRFDILEKVRLHPQQPGIQSLLDLDLYPDVEIEDQGTHLKLHGYLRLNGEYVGGEPLSDGEESQGEIQDRISASAGTEEIAYVIPVEITLPADRVDMNQVSSEVQTFDYKVLSPFELQIEAVLTIDGLLEETAKDADSDVETVDRVATFSVPDPGGMGTEGSSEQELEQDEERMNRGEDLEPQQREYQFVHVARSGSDELESPAEIASSEAEAGEEESDEENRSDPSLAPEQVESDGETVLDHEVGAHTPPETLTDQEPSKDVETTDEPKEDEKTIVFKPAHPTQDREEKNLSDRLLRQPYAEEFDFQGLNDERDKFGIERMVERELEEETAVFEGEEEADGQAVEGEEDSEEKSDGPGLEWTRWILGEEKEQFAQMRMVIVHQEDSIESISDRYEVPASKIVTMNQLESNLLEQGQILYLPTTKE